MIFYQMLFEIPIFLFVFGLQNSAKEFFSNGKFFDNFLGIFFLFCDFWAYAKGRYVECIFFAGKNPDAWQTSGGSSSNGGKRSRIRNLLMQNPINLASFLLTLLFQFECYHHCKLPFLLS